MLGYKFSNMFKTLGVKTIKCCLCNDCICSARCLFSQEKTCFPLLLFT